MTRSRFRSFCLLYYNSNPKLGKCHACDFLSTCFSARATWDSHGSVVRAIRAQSSELDQLASLTTSSPFYIYSRYLDLFFICNANSYAFVVPLKKEKRRSFEHFIVSPHTPSNFEFTMSQDPTSQAPPEVKQEDPATINVKVRVSFESKGGWDRDVALNVGVTNLGRLGPGRGGILQDQTHNEAFQAPGCVCEQGRKGCWQH